MDVTWNRVTAHGLEPMPSYFTVLPNQLILNGATLDAAGTYRVTARNAHAVDEQEVTINVKPRRRQRGQQQPRVSFNQAQYDIGRGEAIDVEPTIEVRNTSSSLGGFYRLRVSIREEEEQRWFGRRMVHPRCPLVSLPRAMAC